jgi:hemerythrin-like metal-binding protein
MTIQFADIRGFASLSERLTPQQCFDFINAFLSFMEPAVLAQRGFIDKYIGDSVMALFPSRGDDALRAALGMLAELARFNATHAGSGPGSAARRGLRERRPAAWQPEYLLGFAAFDEMHRLIFDQIVALGEALQAEDAQRAEAGVRRLLELVAEHFDAEERLMEAHRYPASPRAEHQQHRKFSAFLAALRDEIAAGLVTTLRLAFRCQFLQLDWFISHISVTDRHLERFLTSGLLAQA